MQHDRRKIVALLAGLCLAPAVFAHADEDGDDHDRSGRGRGGRRGRDHDHEYAADAVRSGDILPLREILSSVEKSHPGDVV
ncbi:MAG: hypothetical protein HKN60_04810, partial [Rhizobiales bacterium]|nr:hypothetical protein [Hyphomicrobiales bacterium]